MIIPKTAIKAFLKRPLRDCNTYKSLSETQLDKRMERLPVKPPIWFRLRHHQQVSFLLGAELKRAYLALDTGTGKTLLSIALTRYFRKLGVVKCVLVLVPTKGVKYEWAREITKHSPKTSYCVLAGSSQDKWDQFSDGRPLIVITTYAGLMRMVCKLTKTRKGNKLKPDKAKINQLLKTVDGLILDEATGAKSAGKLPFRICRQISKQAKIVFALSGTPFGRDPTDLWGQMYLVDHGETLGPTPGLFRAAFFSSKINYWGGYEHTFKIKMQGTLNRMLANRMINYEADKADLPHVVPIVKEVKLPVDAVVYVQRAEQAIIDAHGNYQAMRNAFLRMRQISSGFLGYYDDEEGSKAQFEFDDTQKLDLLMSIIESIRPECKIVVFYEYNYSASMIVRELKELKIGHVQIYGGTRHHEKLLHQFDHDPDCRIMLLQNSGGFGLNLQVAQYALFFESPVSPIVRKQAERRVERQGSLHNRVFRYDLVVQRTFDTRILTMLAHGKDLFEAIIRGETCQDRPSGAIKRPARR